VIAGCCVALAITAAIVPKQRSIDAPTDSREAGLQTAYSHAFIRGPLSGPEISVDHIAVELEAMDAEADVIARDEQLDRLLGTIELTDAVAVLRRLHTQRTSASRAAELRLLHRWAEQDAASAAEWIAKSLGDNRREGIAQVAVAWANRDLNSASTWAKSLDEAERENALLHVANEAVRSHPQQAFELARELPPSEVRNNILLHAGAELAAIENAEFALTFASEVTDESLRERLRAAVFATWADTDPSAAATEAAQQLPSRRPQHDAVVGIVQRWSRTDPTAASAWVNSFPDAELRSTAVTAMKQGQ
jgi:hypothetical protein